MFVSDFNMYLVFFFLLVLSSFLNTNSSVHLLLTAELLWITIYVMSLASGVLLNDLHLLSLTFFVLTLSAVEFGIGLILILLQHLITRSINLTESDYNIPFLFNRFRTKLFTSKIR
jgi:NADH:ubiquinone oxidoreductase subunit K